MAILHNRRIILLDGVELVHKEHGPRLLVSVEEVLDGRAEDACGLIIVVHGEVVDQICDGSQRSRF